MAMCFHLYRLKNSRNKIWSVSVPSLRFNHIVCQVFLVLLVDLHFVILIQEPHTIFCIGRLVCSKWASMNKVFMMLSIRCD